MKQSNCDCCRFKNPVGGLKDFTEKETRWLCQLCSKTMASEHILHPALYDDYEPLRTMCFIGNQLRRDLADYFGRLTDDLK